MPRFANSSSEVTIQLKLASPGKSGLSFLRRFAADVGLSSLGRFLAPLRGFFVVASLPTAGAVGCILSPLRGFPISLRGFRISLRGRYQWRNHTRLNISAGWGSSAIRDINGGDRTRLEISAVGIEGNVHSDVSF